MADIQSQLPVKLTDNVNVVAITAGQALKVDNSAVTQPVSGTVTTSPSGTQPISGTVTSSITGTVPVSGTITAVPTGTTTVAGTVTGVPSGTQTVAGTVTVAQGTASNLKAQITGGGTTASPDPGIVTIQGISGGVAIPVSGSITSTPSGTQTIAGTVTAVPTGTTTVAGTVGVSGTVTTVPSGTTPVSGTVTSSITGTVPVSGTITAVPSGTTPVSGTVTSVPSGTQTITGTILTTPGEDVGPGNIASFATSAAVASGSTATMSYTVSTGKTMYLKGIFAASSGAPCRVQLDYGATPTILAVGFYASAMPSLAINFPQPFNLAAGTVINVKTTNNAGAAQDVYSTIIGHEI